MEISAVMLLGIWFLAQAAPQPIWLALGDIGIQSIENRLTPTRGHAGGDDIHAPPNRVSAFAQGIHVVFERLNVRHRGEKGVVRHMRPVFKTNRVLAQLGHATFEGGAEFFKQPFFLGVRK